MAQAALVGAGMQVFGNYVQGQEAANAAEKNAEFIRFQKAKTEMAYARKIKLLEQNQAQFTSRQKGMFAKAGIGFNGSALDVIAQSQSEQKLELFSLKSERDWDLNMADLQARESEREAARYRDFGRQLIGGSGTLLSGAASARQAGGK